MNDLLEGIENWNNYWPLLALALDATGGAVLELGMGDGSSEKLHRFCEAAGRPLSSFDSNGDWAARFRHLASPTHSIQYAPDWSATGIESVPWGVALIDHAPAERRHIDIRNLRLCAGIIVIHDSEPSSTAYMLDRIWPLFRYRVDVQTDAAWASAVSNVFDLHKWRGQSVAGYEVK